MFYNHIKKQFLAVLAASLLLTFSGGICAFADESADGNTSSVSDVNTSADTSSIASVAEETTEKETEETSNVIIAGNSERKAQTEADNTQTDAEDTTANESGENSEDLSADHSADGSDNGMVSLGIFRTTAYCPCYACSEGYGRHTCTGATARSNHTIAVDPRVIPFGSKVMINGVVYTAEDRGGAVKGNHIDIFFDNHAQTWQYGTRAAEVFLLA